MTNNKHHNKIIIVTAILMVASMVNLLIAGKISKVDKTQAQIPYQSQQVISSESYNKNNSVSAMDKYGNTIVVWKNEDNNTIHFVRIDSTGNKIDNSEQTVDDTSTTQDNPQVAMDKNGNFAITWQRTYASSSDIMLRIYKSDLTASSIIKINKDNLKNTKPSIALNYNATQSSENLAIAWQKENGINDTDIYFEKLTADFNTQGITPDPQSSNIDPQIVNTYTTNTQENPSIAMNSFNEFIVTWSGEGLFAGNTMQNQIWMQSYGNDGTTRGANTKVNSNNASYTANPKAAADKSTDQALGGNYVIAYEGGTSSDTTDILVRRVARTDQADTNKGCALSITELTTNSYLEGQQTIPAIKADYAGNFTVAWKDNSRSNKIYAQNFRVSGARKGTEFQVSQQETLGAAKDNPSIAMNDDGQYSITYTDTTSPKQILIQNYISELYKPADTSNTLNKEQKTVESTDTTSHESIAISVSPDGSIAKTWLSNSNTELQLSIQDYIGQSTWSGTIAETAGTNIDPPAISFFKDTQGDGKDRVIVAFSAINPSCANIVGRTSRDIWITEINPSTQTPPPTPTCTLASPEADQNQSGESFINDQVKVSAGLYNQDGGDVEDNYAIIYKKQHFTESSYTATTESITHINNTKRTFTLNTCPYLDGASQTDKDMQCGGTSIDINKTNNNIVTAWQSKDTTSAKFNVYLKTIVAGTAANSTFQASPTDTKNNSLPSVKFINENEYLLSYSNYYQEDTSNIPTAAKIKGIRYNYSSTSDLQSFEIAAKDNTLINQNSQIASDQGNSSTLITWTEYNSTKSNIYGQYFVYQDYQLSQSPATYEKRLIPYGPVFLINSTKTGYHYSQSVDMNTTGTTAVAWTGNYQSSPGISTPSQDVETTTMLQILENPLYAAPNSIQYQPIASQQISAGGKFFSHVPQSVSFPAITIDPHITNSTTQKQTPENDSNYYIEINDLAGDGNSFDIQASAENFKLNGTDSIPVNNLEIKNCYKESPTPTPDEDTSCKTTLVGTASQLQLSTETDNYKAFVDKQPNLLAHSTGATVGQWRIYPGFKLTIPTVTAPGNHTTIITFTLQP